MRRRRATRSSRTSSPRSSDVRRPHHDHLLPGLQRPRDARKNFEGKEILSVIKNYAKTWDILIKYDEDRLEIPNSKQSETEELSYESAILAIKSIKQDLYSKGESVELFGNEKDNSLKGILANIYQTFDGNDYNPDLFEIDFLYIPLWRVEEILIVIAYSLTGLCPFWRRKIIFGKIEKSKQMKTWFYQQ